MTKGHRVFLVSPLLEVESLELCDLACACRLARLGTRHTLKSLNFVLKGRICLFIVLIGCAAIGCLSSLALLQLYLVVQLADKSLFEFAELFFISLECLPKVDKGGQSLRHVLLFRRIRNLDEERDRH